MTLKRRRKEDEALSASAEPMATGVRSYVFSTLGGY